jgi:hypothetical protein
LEIVERRKRKMTTKEIYDNEARDLIKMVRTYAGRATKNQLMTILGNLRMDQYKLTKELRAYRLAENCFRAARKFC